MPTSLLIPGHGPLACMIAVRNDCGLKRPLNQVTVGGSVGFAAHSASWTNLACTEFRSTQGKGSRHSLKSAVESDCSGRDDFDSLQPPPRQR